MNPTPPVKVKAPTVKMPNVTKHSAIGPLFKMRKTGMQPPSGVTGKDGNGSRTTWVAGTNL